MQQERLRLGRDLHDRVLQGLTGISLDLYGLERLIGSDPEVARQRLREMQAIVASQQAELRVYIHELRTGGEIAGVPGLTERLEGLSQRFEQHWPVEVEIACSADACRTSRVAQAEIYSLVAEAVANAAKHSGGKKIQAQVWTEGGFALLRVKDDGNGLPFHGTFTLAELVNANRGPVSLKERLLSIGGDMLFHSHQSGVVIEARFPIQAAP